MSSKAFLRLSLVVLVVLASILAFQPQVGASLDSYPPTGCNLIGATSYVSGVLTDLHSDNGVYMVFRSYASQTSAQTLYAHQENITIAGLDYPRLILESGDANGASLPASTASIGRQLLGEFVYPLSGVTSIPASTWTLYYRAWHSDVPENILTNSPSSVPAGSWASKDKAYSSDNNYAETSTPNATQQYGNYGFLVSPLATIVKVEVGYEAYTENPPNDEKIGISVSWDGGSSFPVEYVSPSLGTSDPNLVTWVDFTNASSWTPDKLSDTNFRTRAKAIQVGPAMGKVRLDWIPVRVTYVINPSAHVDIDILIHQSNGTIRRVIATNVANSGTLSTTAETLSGTYSWPAYTVENETDYLEIDYYLDVTIVNPSATAYLRIDDNTLTIADQTRTTNIMLPSEYMVEVEFTGSSNTGYWTQLIWTIDSAWTIGNVSVTLQLYNYALGAYPTSGDGYIAYTSSATPNTDETKGQIITANSANFRDISGNWKFKIKGVKSTTSQFEAKIDLIEYGVTSVVPPDVAVLDITVSPASAFPGEIVTINVTVKNEGGITETFNVTLYYNETQIGKQTVSSLAPSANTTLTFNWNTTGVSLDTYTIKAVADNVPDETDIADNTYVDGYVEVKAIRDIAVVSVTVSPSTVTVGQTVNITVVVKNEGLVSETFNVTSYYNQTIIGTQTLINLDAGANQTLLFVWNTTEVSMGNYIVKAVASTVMDETDTDDNTFIGGAINVLMVYVHDVAVVSVVPSATEVYVGQVLNVSVVVRNNGNIAETFNVTLYYGSDAIETQTVTDLEPGSETTLIFSWDTTDVTPNVSYSLKAETSAVDGETDTTDNTYIYGTVKVKSQGISPPIDWGPIVPYFIPILLGALGFLVAGILRKKRETGEGFGFFNELTDGGIPDAYSVMIIGGAGSGKSVLCQQLAYEYLTQGKSCIYVTYDIFPFEVRQNMKSFNWDASHYEQKESFILVDCYSSIAGLDSEEKYRVEQPFALSDLGIVMSTAVGEVKRKSTRVFLDSTAPFFARVDASKVTEFLQDRIARIKGDKGVFFFTVGKGTVPAGPMQRLEEIIDCIIELDVHEEKGKTWKRMRIKKLRGRGVANVWIPFKIELKKGITFLPPKGWSEKRRD